MNRPVDTTRTDAVWALLNGVPDPEIPVLSLRDLGIVREVLDHGQDLEVVLTPTYSGCPATEVIAQSVRQAVEDAGFGPARVTQRLAPAWTTDWISAEGGRKLRDYGIAPPGPGAGLAQTEQPLRFRPRAVACPRCASSHTEQLAAFGSTACKSLHRCLACREPFEHFKPL